MDNWTLNCSMHAPCYLDNYNTSVLANRIEIFGDKLAVADWDDIEILQWDGENLNIVGYKNTTRRTMLLPQKIISYTLLSGHLFKFLNMAK